MPKLINQIKTAQSRKELRQLFQDKSVEVQYIMLTNAIDSINKEIESDISEHHIDLAIFKMSQVVLFEDELHVIERVMLKQRVAVR